MVLLIMCCMLQVAPSQHHSIRHQIPFLRRRTLQNYMYTSASPRPLVISNKTSLQPPQITHVIPNIFSFLENPQTILQTDTYTALHHHNTTTLTIT